MKIKMFLVLGSIVIFGLSGCVSKDKLTKARDELRAAKENIAKLEKQLKGKDADRAALKQIKEAAEKKLASCEQRFRTIQKGETAKPSSEPQTSEPKDYKNILEQLRSENTSIQKQFAEKSKALTQLQGLFAQKNKSLSSLQQKLSQKTGSLTSLQTRMDELGKSSLGDKAELGRLQSRVQSKDNELKEKSSQIAEFKKQIEMLQKGAGAKDLKPVFEGAKGFLKK